MKNKPKVSTPRNHVVLALMRRGSGQGVHDKTEKAKRRGNKVELRKSSGFILNYSVFK